MNKISEISFKIFGRVSLQEKINFARHLSIAIKAGFSISEGLDLIKKQTGSKTLKKIISQLIVDVNNGEFLAEGLERYHSIFGSLFVNMVRIGETSGTLVENLLALSEELKKMKEIKSKVKSAMIYPVILLVATLGITATLIFFVFPKIMPIFTSLNVKLPLTTRVLIASSSFSRDNFLYLIAGLFVFIVGLLLLFRNHQFKRILHKILFYLPLISRITVNANMVNLTRSLAALLKSGVKIVEALIVVSNVMENLVYREEIIKIGEVVKKGGQISDYLASKPRYFPVMLAGIVKIGENTGNLEGNLFYLSDYYEGEVSETIKNLTTVLEPALLMFMGLIVGFIAVAIITPIYSITQSV